MNVSDFFDETGIFAKDDQIVLKRPNETDKNEFYRLFLEDEIFEELNKFVDVTQAAEEELHGENRLICWIYNRDSGIFWGYCCIDNISNELPEIGIKLLKTVRNKGFGTRALRLLTQMFSQKTGVNFFRSRVVSDNYACQRVMDKLGAAFVGLSTVIEDTSEVSQTYLRKLEAMFSEEDDEKLTNVAAKYNVDPKMLFSHNLEFRLTVYPDLQERRLKVMTEDDLDSFKRIYISAFSVSKEHQKEYDFAKYLMPFIHDSDKHALMFYSGETAVGVILALEKPSFSDELSVYIEVCAVDAMYQRQGHGTAMINMFLERLGKNAFVTLTTFKSRPSYEWYKKNGFIDDDKVRYLIHNNAVCLIFKEIQNLKEQLNGISENLENYPAEAIEKKLHETMMN